MTPAAADALWCGRARQEAPAVGGCSASQETADSPFGFWRGCSKPSPKDTAAIGAAALFVGLAIAGMFRGYSAVPFWDMWNGYLHFYTNTSQGNWQAWWSQHNEHRIVLSRILFWLDIACFRGAGVFLLVVNALLLALISALFAVMWRVASGGQTAFVSGLLVAWLWSWMNHENLTWGFQSQFFLVLLLPLAGLCALSRSVAGNSRLDSWFIAACAAGVLAVGSMANGIFALPAMAVYVALARLGASRFLMLCCLAAICCVSYFHGYEAPGHHQTASAGLVTKPLHIFAFVLLYLGSPFYFIAERFGCGAVVGCLSGGVLLGASAWTGLRAIKGGNEQKLSLALMVFNGFVLASAFATAAGRVGFGLDAAVTSRYTLSSLMAWAALLVANARPLTCSSALVSRCLTVACFAVIIGLLPLQLYALRSRRHELFGRQVAALALELGVNDDLEIKRVWHDSRVALEHVFFPRAADLSIFGWEPIRDAGDRIGHPYGQSEGVTLQQRRGKLDAVERIWGDERFIRVRGRYRTPAGQAPPQTLAIVKAGVLVGFALVADFASTEVPPDTTGAWDAGFVGYALQGAAGHGVDCVDAAHGVYFSIAIPRLQPWFEVDDTSDPTNTTVAFSAVVPRDGQWAGTDFERTRIAGLTIIGSYETGDIDTGTITLRVRKGDRIAYRSGPSAGRQTIKVCGDPASLTVLPAATTWAAIRFEDKSLPPDFMVEIVDDGDGWGEWSAVALFASDAQR
jgi:hypothetical protein